MAMSIGTVVRFDATQGYGFIRPDDGGEDVFLHARALGESMKDLVRAGSRVEFVAVQGDRGIKAAEARLVLRPSESERAAYAEAEEEADVQWDGSDGTDEYIEPMTALELHGAVTELLIEASPTLTGAQIVEVRAAIGQLAVEKGWVA
jgi:CspA family cold shock protein